MGKDLDSLDWMSPETKAQAKEKLHAVVNKIGYPDKLAGLLEAGDRARRCAGQPGCGRRSLTCDRQLAKIGKPVDHGEWDMTPPTVNAYYDPQMNNVNFPAGYSAAAILQRQGG